ncbi:MARVEL domain-containing protein 3 isoform X2 [Melanotaenia boesemani]|uniref:MARVEL domain-containing protein 3 isoform X2 n=1 Tax=Melanotaenia boesemani TaxID=1250792 RepID=UPI001C057FA3|nr:MARVEL domain-containing protein 3 isoform X2 [Melanotaenia boesemani]
MLKGQHPLKIVCTTEASLASQLGLTSYKAADSQKLVGWSCFYLETHTLVVRGFKKDSCCVTLDCLHRLHSMSQPPRSNRGHRERNGDHRPRSGDSRSSRDDRRSYPDSSSSHPPYYPRDADPSSRYARDVPRMEHHDSKCANVCSRRGIVLICAVLTNFLMLICLITAQMVTSGMTSMAGMSSLNINTDISLQGTELQKVRELDMQYSQMRAPGTYGGIAFILIFGVISLLFVVAGNKPPQLMSWKLLVGSLVFQAVGAVVYVVAIGLYLHFVIQVNSTDVCKQRERIYSRNGYTWMNCSVSGGDAAVALFGIITAILYTAGTVLTVQTIRGVKRYLQERKRREAEKQQARANPQRAPLRAETISV